MIENMYLERKIARMETDLKYLKEVYENEFNKND